MLIIETPPTLRQTVKQWSQEHKRIALIPTMGNLHEGHMALIDAGAPARIKSWSACSSTRCSSTGRKILRPTRERFRRTANS